MKNMSLFSQLLKKIPRNTFNRLVKEFKTEYRLSPIAKSEVFGGCNSNDILRLLPSELIKLEDPDLEYLFYSKMFEHGLLTYELQGLIGNSVDIEIDDKTRGPIVACIDTSGSMSGRPMFLARAPIITAAKTLKEESRALHVILFGSRGQIKEYVAHGWDDMPGLLSFLSMGFNGGTDFETPLNRAVEIIKKEPELKEADIFFVTDGYCDISESFKKRLSEEKIKHSFSVATVICNTTIQKPNWADYLVHI